MHGTGAAGVRCMGKGKSTGTGNYSALGVICNGTWRMNSAAAGRSSNVAGSFNIKQSRHVAWSNRSVKAPCTAPVIAASKHRKVIPPPVAHEGKLKSDTTRQGAACAWLVNGADWTCRSELRLARHSPYI